MYQDEPLTNAKDELIDFLQKHQIDLSEIICASVSQEVENDDLDSGYGYGFELICLCVEYTEEEAEQFWKRLDFKYYSGYGAQTVYGTVWLTEGRWLTRGEYDGSEWWELHVYPSIPDALKKDKGDSHE